MAGLFSERIPLEILEEDRILGFLENSPVLQHWGFGFQQLPKSLQGRQNHGSLIQLLFDALRVLDQGTSPSSYRGYS